MQTAEPDGSHLIMDVPNKMLGTFEDKSYMLGRDLDQHKGLLKTNRSDQGRSYDFNLRKAGTVIGRDQALENIVGMIKTAQGRSILDSYNCVDPYVTLYPIVGRHFKAVDGPLPITIGLPRVVLMAKEFKPANAVMRSVFIDLLDPHCDDNAAQTRVGIEVESEASLSMWIGKNKSNRVDSNPDDAHEASVILRGGVSSHAHQLVFMAGAIALGRSIEQLAVAHS